MKLNFFPFNFIGDVIRLFVRFLVLVRENTFRSIRMQLVSTFVVCVVAASIVYSITGAVFGDFSRYAYIDYRQTRLSIENMAFELHERVKWGNYTLPELEQYANERPEFQKHRLMIVDSTGTVLLKNKNVTETQVDLQAFLIKAFEDQHSDSNAPREYTALKPLELSVGKAFIIVTGNLEPTISYYSDDDNMFGILLGATAFLLLFFWLTKRKMRYIEELARGLLEISRGNLNYRVRQRGGDELGSLALNINLMTEELQRTIEEERRAERTKSELITNVSHDLRTPLTLIMGYLRLLKDRNYENSQQQETYLNIAYNKSEKLKRLIEDLFELTKLSNNGVRMLQERICLNELLEQLLEELVGHAEEQEIGLVRHFTYERLFVTIDADHMIRVFENLLTNAIKYSRKSGEVLVTLRREGDYAIVTIRNFGETIDQEELPRLFDRFYRVDEARTSDAGGSGLGLAIAKSIVEAHKGEIWAECEGDEIRFTVKLALG